MTDQRAWYVVIVLFVLILLLLLVRPARAGDGERGIASHFGPGSGVATQWCTWVRRHTRGCGTVTIQSWQTGRRVTAPVVDWCQCYRHTARERIIDLQWDVVRALGLPLAQGLYPVTVWRQPASNRQHPPALALPNTAMRP